MNGDKMSVFEEAVKEAKKFIETQKDKHYKTLTMKDLIKMLGMCEKVTNDEYKCSDCQFYKYNTCVGIDNQRDEMFDELLAEQQEQM